MFDCFERTRHIVNPKCPKSVSEIILLLETFVAKNLYNRLVALACTNRKSIQIDRDLQTTVFLYELTKQQYDVVSYRVEYFGRCVRFEYSVINVYQMLTRDVPACFIKQRFERNLGHDLIRTFEFLSRLEEYIFGRTTVKFVF